MKECCKTYLNEQFGDDADIVGEIYAEYVSSVNAKISEAVVSLDGGEWDSLDKVAHTIKGNALATGDQEMSSTAIALRMAAKLHESGQAAELIDKLKGFASVL